MRGTLFLVTSSLVFFFTVTIAMGADEPFPSITLQLQWLDPSGSVAPLDWPASAKHLWGRTKTDLGEFFTPRYQISIEPPDGLDIEPLDSLVATVAGTARKSLVLNTTNPVELLRLAVKKSDGSREEVGLRIEFQQKSPELLIHDSCDRAGIKLVPREGAAKFLFLAASCRIEDDRYVARILASDDATITVNDEFSGFIQNNSQELLMEFRRGTRATEVQGTEVLGSLQVHKKISDEVLALDIIREPIFGPERESLEQHNARTESFFTGLKKYCALGVSLESVSMPSQSAFAATLWGNGHAELPRSGLLADTTIAVALIHGISSFDAVAGKKLPGLGGILSLIGGLELAEFTLGGSAQASGLYAFPALGARADFDTGTDAGKMNFLQLAVLPSFSAPPSLEFRADADTGWRVGKIPLGVQGKFQLFNVAHTNVLGFGLGLQGWF